MVSLSEWSRTVSLLATRHGKRFRLLVEVILVVLVARQLAVMSWLLVDQYQATDIPISSGFSVASTAPRASTSESRYAQLGNFPLFGQPEAAKAAPVQAPELRVQDIPVSRMRAKVTGLVAHPDRHKALVVIDNGGRQKTYRVGDEIYKSSATVESIFADRVIISNRGKQEALLIYPNEKESLRPSLSRPTATQTASNIHQIRKQVLANPDSLAELVSISPVRVDGELKGYRINPKQHQQLFAKAGLKPNDLATAINGYDLTDSSQALAVLGQLNTLHQVALTVERQGQLYQIDLSL